LAGQRLRKELLLATLVLDLLALLSCLLFGLLLQLQLLLLLLL